jgi:hypothetical protein
MNTRKTKRLVPSHSRLIFLILTQLLFLGPCARADDPMKTIGSFSPYKDLPNVHQIWVIAENGKVNVRVGGSASYAMSSCPEVWALQESRILPAYIFKERHGIKIRYTSFNLRPCPEPDIHIFYDERFWKVSRDSMQSIISSQDENKLAEIRDHELWFDGRRLGKLAESTAGEWRSAPPDLEVVLADDFHDELILSLNDHCAGSLSDWHGNVLQLRLNDHASVETGALSLSQLRIHANKLSNVDVKSVNCDNLDAAAEKDSVVSPKGGHIAKASTSEIFGGKLTILAEVDKPNGQSTGLTNSQKIIKKQTPQGMKLEFPNYGNFDFK